MPVSQPGGSTQLGSAAVTSHPAQCPLGDRDAYPCGAASARTHLPPRPGGWGGVRLLHGMGSLHGQAVWPLRVASPLDHSWLHPREAAHAALTFRIPGMQLWWDRDREPWEPTAPAASAASRDGAWGRGQCRAVPWGTGLPGGAEPKPRLVLAWEGGSAQNGLSLSLGWGQGDKQQCQPTLPSMSSSFRGVSHLSGAGSAAETPMGASGDNSCPSSGLRSC